MDKLVKIIKQYWGFDSFLPSQEASMRAIIEGRDSLVVLPTGGGKSLCFQAPAMALPGMAVVISPLISLMKDQVDALRANGITAGRIDSSITAWERQETHRAIQDRDLKLLYVSPERMAQPRFTAYLGEAGVSFFVIDEAHCISHWGHDFRPEYRELRQLRAEFPGKAIHAFTATATQQVRDDIAAQLSMKDPALLVGALDRQNLVYRVEARDDSYGQVRRVIDAHPGESGIVYCLRRADVDNLCAQLVEDGFKVLPYHAGMDAATRKKNQDAFATEQVDIIVATVAFGMGIDKSNVRYVVHATMPKSIEHYQQESGRAGRDGLPAECWLFYSYADFRIWERFLRDAAPEEAGPGKAHLRDMLDFCEKQICRHKALVEYFGQTYPKKNCGACDVCLGDAESLEDAAGVAQAILRCIKELGSMAGPTYTTLILTGQREERVLTKGHHKLEHFGALGEHKPAQVRRWLEQLVDLGYLVKTGEYNVLVLTADAQEVLGGDIVPNLTKAVQTRKAKTRSYAGKKSAPLSAVEKQLFDTLRELRRDTAADLNVPPYVIFNDASLRDMAARRPRTKDDLLDMYGVGEKKSADFGEAFLAAIGEFCRANSEAMADGTGDSLSKPKRINSEAVRQAYTLFGQGCSVEEVAQRVQRSVGTVEQYLAQYIEERGITDPSPWVDLGVIARVAEALKVHGNGPLKPLRDHLNQEVSYGDIRICAGCLKNAEK